MFQRPVFHCVGHDTRDLRIQAASFVNGFVQCFVSLFREALPHNRVIKYIDSKDFFYASHCENLPQKNFIQFRRSVLKSQDMTPRRFRIRPSNGSRTLSLYIIIPSIKICFWEAIMV